MEECLAASAAAAARRRWGNAYPHRRRRARATPRARRRAHRPTPLSARAQRSSRRPPRARPPGMAGDAPIRTARTPDQQAAPPLLQQHLHHELLEAIQHSLPPRVRDAPPPRTHARMHTLSSAMSRARTTCTRATAAATAVAAAASAAPPAAPIATCTPSPAIAASRSPSKPPSVSTYLPPPPTHTHTNRQRSHAHAWPQSTRNVHSRAAGHGHERARRDAPLRLAHASGAHKLRSMRALGTRGGGGGGGGGGGLTDATAQARTSVNCPAAKPPCIAALSAGSGHATCRGPAPARSHSSRAVTGGGASARATAASAAAARRGAASMAADCGAPSVVVVTTGAPAPLHRMRSHALTGARTTAHERTRAHSHAQSVANTRTRTRLLHVRERKELLACHDRVRRELLDEPAAVAVEDAAEGLWHVSVHALSRASSRHRRPALPKCIYTNLGRQNAFPKHKRVCTRTRVCTHRVSWGQYRPYTLTSRTRA